MFPGTQETIDIAEQLRKRQLMQQMQQQPTTQPAAQVAPNFGQPIPQSQPQTQFNPNDYANNLANITKNLPFGQPKIPPTAPIEESGAAYVKEAGKQIKPGDYPRNKILTALVAPLMLKQFIRNPQQASENLNFMTRKGYGAAEQQHAMQLEATKADYTAKRQIFMDQMTAATEGIKGNNEWVNQQIHMLDLGITTPLKIQQAGAELTKTNLEIAKLKAGDVQTNEPWHLMVDGKETIGFPHKTPDGTMGWTDAGTGKPIEGTVKPVGKVVEGQLSPVNQLIQRRIAELGHTPSINEYRDIVVKSETDIAEPAEKRAEARDIRTEKRHEQAVTDQRMTAAQNSARSSIKANIDKQNAQVTNLTGLNRTLSLALDPKSANEVAQVLAPIELDTTLASPGARLSRYNSKAISDFRAATGKPNEWWAKLKNYLGKGSPVPEEMLKQIRPLIDAQVKTFQEERAIERAYLSAVNSAKTEADLEKALAKHDESLQALYTTEATPPPPKGSEDRTKALHNMSDKEIQDKINALQKK